MQESQQKQMSTFCTNPITLVMVHMHWVLHVYVQYIRLVKPIVIQLFEIYLWKLDLANKATSGHSNHYLKPYS